MAGFIVGLFAGMAVALYLMAIFTSAVEDPEPPRYNAQDNEYEDS